MSPLEGLDGGALCCSDGVVDAEQVMTEVSPLLRKVAHGLARRYHLEEDDLYQEGAIGVLTAIEGYQPGGMPLEHWCLKKGHWAMQEAARDRMLPVHRGTHRALMREGRTVPVAYSLDERIEVHGDYALPAVDGGYEAVDDHELVEAFLAWAGGEGAVLTTRLQREIVRRWMARTRNVDIAAALGCTQETVSIVVHQLLRAGSRYAQVCG